MVGRSVVVAPHHRCVVGIGTDDGDGLFRVAVQGQRQARLAASEALPSAEGTASVLQQHEGLACHLQ